MNEAAAFEDDDVRHTTGSILTAAPDMVEVRRNGGVAGVIGAAASAVAIAYLARAAQTGAVLDWTLAVVMGGLAALHLHALVDARTPLLVADAQGVRIRLGRAWQGLPWGALAEVEHTPRQNLLRDGRITLVPRNPERLLGELDASGRRQSRISQRLYGAPFTLPLGLATRVVGPEEDLTTALRQLAGNSARVVELLPGSGQAAVPEVEIVESDGTDRPGFRMPDPRPVVARFIIAVASRLPRLRSSAGPDGEAAPEMVASETPEPLRETSKALRSEVRSAGVEPQPDVEGRELRRPGSVSLVEETRPWGDRVRPIARGGDSVEPLVIDDFAVEPAEDPVIGPELAAARTRLGLTVDRLAERTRIRPHVIESIEVDDFAPCGGDFYARGHLRTLARVLGTDATPLLAAYDDRYADAPINPRRIFEAELATGANGGIRSTRGGPNWSVLIAVIMTLVLAWSIARLVMDTPVELQSPAPVLNGSDGPNLVVPAVVERLPLTLTASNGDSKVVVRDSSGKVVFRGKLMAGETRSVDALPPVTVHATDAGAVTVSVDGVDKGAIGKPGREAERTFRAPS